MLLVQSRTEHAVLPEGHPQRTSTLLERAVAAVEGSVPAHVAPQLLHQMIEEEDAAYYQVCTHAFRQVQ